ncbi:TIGR02444 family protein [Caulobacter sp.]|uniref:TIGR02444 family protein n=1 Tax=Caulobacter sp. TaxID=78 RepID=UPI002B48CCD2|nr:TIGR02444 family protein [Caulobacter sp.]HJV42339.1 TIGR02444 family protein [Caulobacter sp.]
MRLWDWALEVYARQPVAEACLSLQDAHGQNVPYLLWGAWMAVEGRSADLKDAARLMRAWDAEVGAPLRGVRRALKPPRPPVDEAAKETLRDAVKAVELQGERVLMESLEALTGPPGAPGPAPRPALDGLVAAAEASGDPPRRAALERLAFAIENADG